MTENNKNLIERHPTASMAIFFIMLVVAICTTFCVVAFVCWCLCGLIGINFSWLYAIIGFGLLAIYICKIGD